MSEQNSYNLKFRYSGVSSEISPGDTGTPLNGNHDYISSPTYDRTYYDPVLKSWVPAQEKETTKKLLEKQNELFTETLESELQKRKREKLIKAAQQKKRISDWANGSEDKELEEIYRIISNLFSEEEGEGVVGGLLPGFDKI